MSQKVSDWIGSEQLKELIAMASPTSSEKLKYMPLADFKGLTERGNGRQLKGLPRFSIFVQKDVAITPQGTIQNDSIRYLKMNSVNKAVVETVLERIAFLKEEIDKSISELKNQEREIRLAEVKRQEDIKRDKEKEKALSNGLALLNLTNCRDLGAMQSLISRWLKKADLDLVPEYEQELLYSIIVQVVAKLNNRNREGFINQDHDLKRIISWVGEEKGKEWHAKISANLNND